MFLQSCGPDESVANEGSQGTTTTEERENKAVTIPAFERDSAYAYVARQVSFGPRNPGSEGIEECRQWIIGKLREFGADVHRQEFTARVYTGEEYASVNIIGSFNPGHTHRVLLAAHYDTRFMAEEDKDPEMQDDPILGADDGASGVGVLLEIARLIGENGIDIGVDFIFFDAEDQGKRGGESSSNETWCLGAQYWSRNPHVAGYAPKFGILLDMVGSKNAFFNRENVARVHPHADEIHDLYNRVWNLARAMGKGRYFQNRQISGIIDDHFFVNRDAGIPMIDIINKPPGAEDGFDDYWHTHNDDLDIIDKNTLGSVGQVVTAVVYREAAGKF